MLRSASDEHPHGLANGSGLVGRNYMRHNNRCVHGDVEDAKSDADSRRHSA